MATATITLYLDSKIEPSRNMKLDLLETYLDDLEKVTISSFQYQRPNLIQFDIKVDRSQSGINYDQMYNYDYCKIRNSNSNRNLFYFITERRWKSENTIEFHLVLDTINSFAIGYGNTTGDYIINDKTNVIREHRDRFSGTSAIVKDGENMIDLTNLPTPISSSTIGYNLTTTIHIPDSNFSHSPLINTNFIFYATVQYIGENDSLIRTELKRISFTRSASSYPNCHQYVIRFTLPIKKKTGIANPIHIRSMRATYQYNSDVKLVRSIDLLNEGLTPILYKKELGELHQPVNTSWNLVYQTAKVLSEEDNNVVNCYLYPDEELSLKMPINKGTIDSTYFTDDNYYYFVESTPIVAYRSYTINSYKYEPMIIVVNGDRFSTSCETMPLGNVFAVIQRYFLISKVGGHFYVTIREATFRWNNFSHELIEAKDVVIASYTDPAQLKFETYENITAWQTTSAVYGETLKTNFVRNFTLEFGDFANVKIASISELDRTQSTLIKIIKIPYTPNDYDILGDGSIVMDSKWKYDELNYRFQLENVNTTKFETKIESDIENPLQKAFYCDYSGEEIDPYELRNDVYESKLYHSEFYQIKFIYDSFSYVFQLEKIDLENTTINPTFEFNFIMTTTMNSKFAFMYPWLVYAHSTEDYDNVLPIGRNNEVVIYNSTYLNYLRTAYNYDVKAKERAEIGASIGTGASVVGTIGGMLIATATQSTNPYTLPVAIVTGVTAIGVALANQINTIAQAEANLETKKWQLQNQAVSVAGSDDVDIMTAYSNNRAKLVEYKVSQRMKNALFNLFYLTGYITNENKIPNFYSRAWFNFISMDINVIENKVGIPEEIMNDIKARWKNGVTIYHMRNGSYDFEQKYENWEVSLL